MEVRDVFTEKVKMWIIVRGDKKEGQGSRGHTFSDPVPGMATPWVGRWSLPDM